MCPVAGGPVQFPGFNGNCYFFYFMFDARDSSVFFCPDDHLSCNLI